MRIDTRQGELRFSGANKKALVMRYPHSAIALWDGDQTALQLVIDTSLFNWGEHRSAVPHSVSIRLDRRDVDFLLVNKAIYQKQVMKLAGRNGISLEVKLGVKTTDKELPEETCATFTISGLVLPADFRVTRPDQRLFVSIDNEAAERFFEALKDLMLPVEKRTITAPPQARSPAEQLADEMAWADYQFAA